MIADTNGPFEYIDSLPSLNDSGMVAFVAQLSNGKRGIFTGSGGPTTTIADSSGFLNFFGATPSLNNSGTVAFNAFLDIGDDGIFTGPDLLADKVIGENDMLFGSTVRELLIFPESLNDKGQIAFFYKLADERSGIARADPLVIPAPEPGTLPLLIAGLLGAVLWRKGKLT